MRTKGKTCCNKSSTSEGLETTRRVVKTMCLRVVLIRVGGANPCEARVSDVEKSTVEVLGVEQRQSRC